MKTIKLSAHLAENISGKVLKNRALVFQKISTQNIKLRAILKHTDKQPRIRHIDLKNIRVGIAVKGKLCRVKIAASRNNSRIFNPLKAASKS